MRITTSLRTSTRRAFTLVELLVVIGILAALAGITITIAGVIENKKSEEATRLMVNRLSSELESYHLANGTFPEPVKDIRYSSNALYRVLFGDFDDDGKPDDGAKIYISELDPALYIGMKGRKTVGRDPISGLHLIYDAWGVPYHYRLGFDNGGTGYNPDFDIWSQGGDKQDDTKDDVANFRKNR